MLHCEHGLPGLEAVLGPSDENIHTVLMETVPGVVEGGQKFFGCPPELVSAGALCQETWC